LIKKLWPFIARQYDVGIWLGAIRDLFSRATFYVSFINFVLIVPTAYNTTLKFYIQQYVPWMSFWIFASICVLLTLLAMTFEQKLVLASSVRWQNRMRAKHYSPEYEIMKIMMKKIGRIEERLGLGEDK